jgi:hypothetical protein
MPKPRSAHRPRTGQASPVERRAWIRYPTDRDAFCQPETGRKDHDLWWQAQIRDISTGGIGLVLNRGFKPGTLLSVELPSTNQSLLILRLARVVHATAQADGSWVIGCEFATHLRDDDLQALTGTGPARATAPAGANAGTGNPGSRPTHAEMITQPIPRPPLTPAKQTPPL